MMRLPLAQLMAFAPLVFSCSLTCAFDIERPETPQCDPQVPEPTSDTAAYASELDLATDPAPTAIVAPPNYGRLLLHDARYILSSPTRWDRGDWRDIGLIGLAVVGTAAVLDRPVQNAVQRNRNRTSDSIARVFEPFGAEYSLAVLGGFYLAGAVNDDPKAKAVAQDGLAASLIASGLITPVLKLAVGRSRPAQDEGTHRFRPSGGNASFPSGHVTQAFAVASVIATHYEPLWVKATAYGFAVELRWSASTRGCVAPACRWFPSRSTRERVSRWRRSSERRAQRFAGSLLSPTSVSVGPDVIDVDR